MRQPRDKTHLPSGVLGCAMLGQFESSFASRDTTGKSGVGAIEAPGIKDRTRKAPARYQIPVRTGGKYLLGSLSFRSDVDADRDTAGAWRPEAAAFGLWSSCFVEHADPRQRTAKTSDRLFIVLTIRHVARNDPLLFRFGQCLFLRDWKSLYFESSRGGWLFGARGRKGIDFYRHKASPGSQSALRGNAAGFESIRRELCPPTCEFA